MNQGTTVRFLNGRTDYIRTTKITFSYISDTNYKLTFKTRKVPTIWDITLQALSFSKVYGHQKQLPVTCNKYLREKTEEESTLSMPLSRFHKRVSFAYRLPKVFSCFKYSYKSG